MAYVPCAAHNIQLVIQDGMNLNIEFTSLINRISKDIVCRTKNSMIVAEELRAFNKKLCKKNLTRWNSILFMIRSVLKVTPAEYIIIRSKMPYKTQAQKLAKKNFVITEKEREMLEDLQHVLLLFEFVTDEFQSNQISISRVIPCYNYLKKNLESNQNAYQYTSELRADLIESLERRFGPMVQSELCQVATFLDPNFGHKKFKGDLRLEVIHKVKLLLDKIVLKDNLQLSKNSTSLHKSQIKRKNNYNSSESEDELIENSDLSEEIIKEYCKVVTITDEMCPLKFWKAYESRFPKLALLAKQFLSVQASSAAVERMFSISGIIFSLKRRSMGIKHFCNLVFLKVNELFF